jgi:hypothetical protein
VFKFDYRPFEPEPRDLDNRAHVHWLPFIEAELVNRYRSTDGLGEMRLTGLGIGPDGCNRCLLSVFQTVTGRNAPSNTQFIFGRRAGCAVSLGRSLASRWRMSIGRPQEIAIAAALSGDDQLLAAYQTGDIYIAFDGERILVS